jgi:tetratricopeptide (TPR) repeat protein
MTKTLLFLLSIIFIPSNAFSKTVDEDSALKFIEAGKRFYSQKKYNRAILEFKKSLAIKKVPTILFNLAQAYYKAKKYRPALRYYKLFLPQIPYVKKLTKKQQDSYILGIYKLIKILEHKIRIENKKKKTTSVKKSVNPPKILIKKAKKPIIPNHIITKPGDQSLTKQWWFWTGIGATIVFTAGTTYFGLKAISKIDDWQHSWDPKDEDSANLNVLLSDISVAGAILSAGTVITLSIFHLTKSKSSPKETHPVAIIPGCTPTGCTISFALNF